MQDQTWNSETNTIEPRNLLSIILPAHCRGIESNPGPQTGSTRGNSPPRGGPKGRGCGCYGRGIGSESRQDPIDYAFAGTSVRDPAGLSNQVDPPYTLRRASRSQNLPSVSSQQSVSSWLTSSQTQIQPAKSSRTNITNTNVQSGY